GHNISEFWKNLVDGASGAGPITHFDASKFKTQFACEIKNFDVKKYMDRKEARKMDLYTQYAVVVAGGAVTDSGLDLENVNLIRIGVVFGAGIGGINTLEEATASVTHHKPVTTGTKRTGSSFRIFIASGQGMHGIKPTHTDCCDS
ncbi:3-oxoacyl-[acyl-carrier-protein] synthase 2, partial [termite gut metagenome]